MFFIQFCLLFLCFCLRYTMNDLSPIMDYIRFLKFHHALSVALHPQEKTEVMIRSSELIVLNHHENPYCAKLKQYSSVLRECVKCHKKIYKNSKAGPCSEICFAGVKEWVYPITNGTETTGYISVSGYRTDCPEVYFEKLSQDFHCSVEELSEAYSTLNQNFPEKSEVDTLLLPLCQMLELAYIKNKSPKKELSLVQKAILYIKQNRNQEDLTSRDICKHLFCSRSVLSSQFNKETGKTIREYITELRIADAKQLLKDTKLSVTEISYLVGFGNSNYFSQIFKKQVSLSPIQYRKRYRDLQ